MRILVILLVTLTACLAQSDQSQLEAVLQKMERAEQTGDFNTWQGLWTPGKASEMEKMRPYAKSRPEVRFVAMKSFARGDKGVLLVKAAGYPDNPFITMTLRKEGGQWKVQDELFRETAPDPSSVYAL